MEYMNRMNIIEKNSTFLLFIEGWNSWYSIHHSINEEAVRQSTDAIVATGLAAAGYQYGISLSYFMYTNHYLILATVYSEYG